MLVNLYALPEKRGGRGRYAEKGIRIIRAMTPNKRRVTDYILRTFGEGWASECETAFCHFPVSCFIAVDSENEIVGFACYDATMKGYFGPTGVSESARHLGIGAALLDECLVSMRNEGYGYAVIGGAGPTDFYKKACGAVEIENCIPNIYKNLI